MHTEFERAIGKVDISLPEEQDGVYDLQFGDRQRLLRSWSGSELTSA
jgi:hypothetical protein